MKKFILSTIVILAFTFTANAQFGVRAGVNFASSKFEAFGQSTNSESSTGFYVGAFAIIKLGETLGIRPELNYVSVDVNGFNFDQFQIPVFLQFGVGESVTIMAGPNFGFRTDTGNQQESFNLGIDMGLAFDVGENFLIEARYNLGTTDFIKSDIAILKLNGFQVGGAFKF